MLRIHAANYSISTHKKLTINHLEPSFRTCLKHYQSLDSDRLL